MTTDQPVISLRPGGGGGGPRGSRLFSPAFAVAASGSGDFLRPLGGGASGVSRIGDLHFETRERIRYSRDQLLELREITDVPEQILRVKQEIEAELHGDDQSWVRSDSNVQLQTQTETQTQGQAQNRFTETDNRDWRARTEKPPAPAVQEEKSWDNIRETKELYNSEIIAGILGDKERELTTEHLGADPANEIVGPPRRQGRLPPPADKIVGCPPADEIAYHQQE